MKRFLSSEGTDTAIAALTFVTLCQGDSKKRPPLYGRAARTIWRVENDGRPPPDVNVFNWGGDVFGVPELRIWYVQQGSRPPVGVGAFLAARDAVIPERGELTARIAQILKAPGCYLVGDEA